MKREITLEEYFRLDAFDAEDRVEDVVAELNGWEPRMKFNIDDILGFGVTYKKHDAAIALLNHLVTVQLTHSLRRAMTDLDIPNREQRVEMLVFGIVQNISMSYDARFEAISYYIDNKRFKSANETDWIFDHALRLLAEELKHKCIGMYNTLKPTKAKEILWWFDYDSLKP